MAKVTLSHTVELTLIKHGAEFPKLFSPGDVVEVDEATENYLRDIGYLEDKTHEQ